MQRITSRQNRVVQHVRRLNEKRSYRQACGEFVCDGGKLLAEALASGAEVLTVLAAEDNPLPVLPEGTEVFCLPRDLLGYVSRLETPADLLFTCRLPAEERPEALTGRVLVLDGVQDPGNVGTVLRTAEAFSTDCVVLVNGCADPYGPKTVRATMGAIFRQKIVQTTPEELVGMLARGGMKLYAAALSDRAVSLRDLPLQNAAVAVGSEGSGVSQALLDLADGEVIIPMTGGAESLNAAVAAAILLWEMQK